jgi:lipoyl(octanoyl) transferase
MPAVRLLPYAAADGPTNMAADEALLESAGAGVASLRFYGWSEATVSLGYFQPERRRREAGLAHLSFVRRPSGGDALVHHHELTYALGLPAGAPWQVGEPWPVRMHRIIAGALSRSGVAARLHVPNDGRPFDGFLCFQHVTSGDLLVGPSKVVGSAQRRRGGAILQHGGVLLAASSHTPQLPGLRELCGRVLADHDLCEALAEEWTADTGWPLEPGDWTAGERDRWARLAREKYGRPEWNAKR